MYRIRAFGDVRECPSLDDLREALAANYRGRSVAFEYDRAPHGMRRSHFIDVLDDGSAVESYGKQAPVDFEAIQADKEGRHLGKENRDTMEGSGKYQQTHQLLDVVSNQSSSPIKADDAKAAKQQLNQSSPDTSGAKAIIETLRGNEMHPALSDAVNKAAHEVAAPAPSRRRRPRM